jgi:ATP-grasp domain, R2K clade family 3
MYYLIQSNIHSDPEHYKVFDVLDNLNLQYETIEVDASTEEITVASGRKDVFIYGSVKLARLAKANKDWIPGSFYGGNHTFEIYSAYYKHNLLNYETAIFKFAEQLTWLPGEEKFIKPYKDAKVFTGRVFTEMKWNDFVQQSLLHPKTPMLNNETLVQASGPQELIKEARLWIVGGTVVAGVYYRFHGDVPFESEVSREGIEFAEAMIQLFNVADAFVMDIGLTFNGWKIVEINCINSAGFYNLNVRTLFRALEAYF